MSKAEPIRRRYEMPLLLLCGLGLSAFFSALGTFAFTVMAVTLPFSSSYSIDGHPATRAEFLHSSWPLFVAFPPLLLLFGTIAYALWRERPWSRRLMLAFWGVNVIAGVGIALSPLAQEGGAWAPVCVYLVLLIVAWWYLYRKPNVAAYYRLLEEQAAASSGGGPPAVFGEHGA